MSELLSAPASGPVIAVHAVSQADWPQVLSDHSGPLAAFAQACGFKARSGDVLLVPNTQGQIERVVFGLGAPASEAAAARIASSGFRGLLLGALLLGIIVPPIGIYASAALNLPTGPSIVLVHVAVLALAQLIHLIRARQIIL